MRAGRDGLVRTALAVAPRPLAPEVRTAAATLTDDAAPGVRSEALRALASTDMDNTCSSNSSRDLRGDRQTS
jgi:hypothetical protein